MVENFIIYFFGAAMLEDLQCFKLGFCFVSCPGAPESAELGLGQSTKSEEEATHEACKRNLTHPGGALDPAVWHSIVEVKTNSGMICRLKFNGLTWMILRDVRVVYRDVSVHHWLLDGRPHQMQWIV